MCCNRSVNTKINRLLERCPRTVYIDKNSTFNEVLEKDSSVSIHQINLQKLAVEMFKVPRDLSPEIINEIFQFKEDITYELRQRSQFHIISAHSVFRGTESLKFLGPKILPLVPNKMKQLESLGKFREEIKQWKPTSRLSGLSKRCKHRIGFL